MHCRNFYISKVLSDISDLIPITSSWDREVMIHIHKWYVSIYVYIYSVCVCMFICIIENPETSLRCSILLMRSRLRLDFWTSTYFPFSIHILQINWSSSTLYCSKYVLMNQSLHHKEWNHRYRSVEFQLNYNREKLDLRVWTI